MKKLLSFFTLSLLFSWLAAQTQTLPDLKVSGESGIKAYLYKRSLLFSPLLGYADSLPAFVPNGTAREELSPRAEKVKHQSYLQLEGNTVFGVNGFFSYYPQSVYLNGLSYHLQLTSPETSRISSQNNLYLGTQFSADLPLSLKLGYYSSEADAFNSRNLDISLAHYHKAITLAALDLENTNLQLGYDMLNQKNLATDFKTNYLNGYFSTQALASKLDLKLKLYYQAGEGAVDLAPAIPWEPLDFSNIRVHFLADAYNFIPSVEFSYRNPISNGGVFSCGNYPKFTENSFSSQLEDNPWLSLNNSYKLQKSPLNLVTQLEYLYSQNSDFSLSRLVLSDNLKYDLHVPILASGINYGIAEPVYTDIFSNSLQVEAFFRMGEFRLHQSCDFNLAYLSGQNMVRAPYQPAMKIDSRFYYPLKNWLMGTDILQHYFTLDHLGNHLPETISINLDTEYRQGNSAVYAQVENLLNRKIWVFSELPPQRITFYLGAKHRF